MTQDSKPQRSPIAVVGLSAIFPGSVESRGFWKDILAGSDLITDVPPSHWLIEDYYDPDPSVPDKTYARRGAFLPKVDFDAMGWGVPPSIVPETDTSQLLSLIVAQQVLEDACGDQIDTIDRSRISCILGVTSGQELLGSMVSRLQRPIWVKALRESGLPEDEVQAACDRISANYTPWRESTFPGLLGNVVAGRIANRLNLGGTNCVTDAACASTFSALAMGINELQLGDSDLVIAGGVDTMNDIFMYMCFSKTPALSATGDCRPFSDQADGTMLAEGIGMVALKRLADAERDGDRIYAVINGVGTSSDGRSKSVYAPVSEGQAKALNRAYDLAGYGPDTVELVEAHGTGTKAGDAAEFGGLKAAFEKSGRSDPQWCTLGSVKSQIGHAKAAAGAAGLIKAILALHHKVLPPTIKVERPNPSLDLPSSPFHLATRARPWVRAADHPRRASVSSFGFGGSNFHVAMSEYLGGTDGAGRPAGRLRSWDVELVALSAGSSAAVANLAREHAAASGKPGYLTWLARHSQQTFDAGAAARLVVLAGDESELASRLEQAARTIATNPEAGFTTPAGIHFGVGAVATEGGLALLFAGQGSQYLHMGADLAMQCPAAIEPWDSAAALSWDGERKLHQVVFPPTAFTPEDGAAQEATLAATEWAQPAIGCTSLGQLALLRELGLEADSYAGHSFGEVTALHAAGVISREDFLAVARKRGELMAAAADIPGAMLAVSRPIEQVRELLARWGSDVVIANHNAPDQVVLSGATTDIEALETRLAGEKITARRLPVATAFHSPVVAGASKAFAQYLGGIKFSKPRAAVYSNTTAATHSDDPKTLKKRLGQQLAQPVRFVDMIEAMYASGVRTFIEVGPGAIQTGLVDRILGERPHLALNLDRKGRGGLLGLQTAIARLLTSGRPLQLDALWRGYREPANPHDRPEPKLTLKIDGSNYGKPYPPPGGASALPAPNPPRPVAASAAATPAAKPPATEPAAPAITAISHAPSAARAQDERPPLLRPVAAAEPDSAPAAPTSLASVGSAPAISPPPGNPAFAEAQRLTADAHASYLQAMSESHSAFLNAVERGFQVLGAQPGIALERQALAEQVQDSIPQSLHQDFARPLPVMQAAVGMNTPAPVLHAPAPAAAPRRPPPVAVPASPTPAPAPDLKAMMLDIVAEKTGYPADMLSLDMELEGDLGIDSIKRVEILSTMSDRAPGLPPVDTAAMAELQTLGQVVDYMNGLLPGGAGQPGPASTAAAAASPEAPTASPALGRFTLAAVERPPMGLAQPGLYGPGTLLICGEAGGLGAALVSELSGRGIAAELSHTVSGARASTLQGVVYLGGLGEFASDAEALACNREAFIVAREAAAQLGREDSAPGLFATVQDTGGAFATTDFDPRLAWASGLAGLTRTVRQEWPNAFAKAIDLERAGRDAASLARALADELVAGGPDSDVGLQASGRRVALTSQPVAVTPGAPSLGAGDVIVATGGGRGVTATTLIALAAEAPLRLVLLGRSPLEDEPACCAGAEGDAALKRALLRDAQGRGEKPTPAALGAQVRGILASREIRTTLAAIAAAGSEARYASCDATDAASVATTLAAVRREWGPIAGIVHGAGVLADKRIAEKTPEQFDRVFDTKIDGLRALLEATAGDPLKVICLFSSVAARCGNQGQCDYAMANEILNKVAVAEARRRGDSCVVKAMGWGPWEGGMVTPSLKAHFESMGVPLIPLTVGARMLVDELRCRAPGETELVLGGEPRSESLHPSGQEPVLTVEVSVGPDSHPYLAHHAIHGAPVVPVALVIEWFARTARAFSPKLNFAGLRDLEVVKGIALQHWGQASEHLRIQCRQVSNGNGALLALELHGPGGRLHYRCHASMVGSLSHLAETTAPTEQPDADAMALEAWGERAIYDGELLFHGPDFQAVKTIGGISAKGITADLEGIRSTTWTPTGTAGAGAPGDRWHTDPLALDGGLQLALLWCQHVLGGASLPTGIDEVRMWSAEPAEGPLQCTLIGRTASGHKSVSDLVFRDARGAVVAELLGVKTHLLPGTAGGDRGGRV